MFAIYYCIRDQHDWRLILLAGLVCIISTVTAVMLVRQSRRSVRERQILWLSTAGVATGFGIWATHFIAMLGYDPGVVVGYHVPLTIGSLVIAIAMTSAGLMTASRIAHRFAIPAGATLVGLGISAMHYAGMNAVELPGRFAWSTPYVAASIVFAILPTIPALALAIRRETAASGVAASTLLMASILLLHFTGMAGVHVVADPDDNAPGMLMSSMSLGLTIGAASIAMLALCAFAAMFSRNTNAKIVATERQFRIFVQGISDCAIYMLDAQGRVVNWNAGAQRLKGYTPQEAIGMPLGAFYSAADRADGAPERGLAEAASTGKFSAEGWRYRKDGSRFWAHVTIERVNGANGEFIGFAKITRDMTRFKEDQDRLARLRDNLDAALANMHQGLVAFDRDERVILHNERVLAMFGLTREQCPLGISFREMIELILRARAGGGVAPAMIEEVLGRHRACIEQPEGGKMVIDFTADCTLAVAHRPMPEGGWVSTFEDVTELRRSEERIAHMAHHDDLTGLPNRASFNRQLDHVLASSERSVGVIAIDLDRFKEINDARGHGAGDEVLRQLARRMAAAIDEGEFVARLGGDEFAAFKPFVNASELAAFAARLEACLSQPIEIDGLTMPIGASLGVARFPADGQTREQVFNNADLAMYRAKATVGQQVCWYEPGMDELARARRILANDLREAIANQELSLAYQVQKSVGTGEITGYEALLRWHHPRDGWISPAEFIPIAEETGEILPIGAWVLRTACAEAARWEKPHKLAVNISPVQLMNTDLVSLVTQTLIETGLSPRRLELEITESAIVADKLRALHVLRQIKALGVTIAMDDFGTGYSSLDTLNSFPFDKIKIDKSFLFESDTSMQARAIIRTVLALGRSLNIPVLAEGLESEDQLRLLGAEGCDEAQGYLFGRPQPSETIATKPRAAA